MTIPIPSSKSPSALQLKLQERLAAIRLEAQKVAAQKQSLASHCEELYEQPSPKAPAVISSPSEEEQTNPTEVPGAASRILEAVHGNAQSAANLGTATDRFGKTIVYNTNQQRAVELIASGQSCVVIGAAGTGKTTIQKGSTAALIQSGLTPPLASSYDHKHLRVGAPGIAICAYTRRATNNIRKNLSEDLQSCCLTIHKLLEYEPVEYYITDADGKEKRTMRFEPTRNVENPLPAALKTIIIEESSMVSYELFMQLVAACPHEPQFVFLGDIQQLPPVFGAAILGFKMLELPVVELTEVYRQALESPILSLAHRILSGKPILGPELKSLCVPKKLTLHPWIKKISPDNATVTLAKFFIKALNEGKYNPETDGILIPFNKSCGTLELNKHIATEIARKDFKPVVEIIHGFKRSYYSVGDKCLYDKEDCIIEEIVENPQYVGIKPREPSFEMNYWGHGTGPANAHDNIDQFLDAVSIGEEDGDKKMRAASHIITLNLLDSERTIRIKSAGEIDALDLGYCLTIHKSQGSEWSKVFLCLHHSHNVMIARELLYTAVTRAKEELFCICEPDSFEKGIVRQRIPGNTWQEKAKAFQGRIDNEELQS
jgi:exodeoxyribonuclease V alpha subunit